jgi:chemotaxis protein CheY-P-specific phosphatase CheC
MTETLKMKVQSILTLSLILVFTSCSPAQFQDLLNVVKGETKLSNQEVSSGLKEALDKGISAGVDKLSAVDGFYKTDYKIFLPDEARKVVDKLKFVPGFQEVEQIAIEKINRAAEDAAAKAKPIFVDAIKGMTFDDAMNILMGADNAATQYLNNRTSQQLYDAFHPVILNSLNKFGAIDYWADAVKAYNKIPFVEKLNPEIDDYVTLKSLDAMFDMVEKKEKGIRNDVSQRTSALLKKVFGAQDNR